jgi:molybdopterin molybdotransferase
MTEESPKPKADGLRTVEEALALLLERAPRPSHHHDVVPLSDALGRVLALPVISLIDVPGWDNSAMDGYAVHGADLVGERPRLRVAQRIAAGTAGAPLQQGTAARIFTGAPMPPGADTVVIQEVCERDGDEVVIGVVPKSGANVRRIGEDIRAGSEVIAAGTRLGPAHLGLAASVGVADLAVYPRVRVALFCSGDELVAPGRPLGPGQIYNSNQYTATGLLQALGCEVVSMGIVPDSLEQTVAALADAAGRADLVIGTGGVSVGEEDHVKPALERLGSLDLWRIAMRPGKPLAFGRIGSTPFIGTPGNPVSLFVTFVLFARPFILRMQGREEVAPQVIPATADFDWPRPDKRREYARARLARDAEGVARVSVFPSRSSAVLSSVAWADGLVEIPEGRVVSRGERVDFLPFSGLLS